MFSLFFVFLLAFSSSLENYKLAGESFFVDSKLFFLDMLEPGAEVPCFVDQSVSDQFLTRLWQKQVDRYFKNEIGYDDQGHFYGYTPIFNSEDASSFVRGERETPYCVPFEEHREGFYIRYVRPKEAAEDKTAPKIYDIYPINAKEGSAMYPKGLKGKDCSFDHEIFEKQPVLWTFSLPYSIGTLLVVRNFRPISVAGGFLILYEPCPFSQRDLKYPFIRLLHLTQLLDDSRYRKDILELLIRLSLNVPTRCYLAFSSYGGNCSNAHFHSRLESLDRSEASYFEHNRGLGHFNFVHGSVEVLVDQLDRLIALAHSENLPFNMGFYQGKAYVFVCHPQIFNPSFSGYNKGFGSLEKIFNFHALYDKEIFQKLLSLPKEEVVRIFPETIRRHLSIEQDRVERYARQLGFKECSGVLIRRFSSQKDENTESSLLYCVLMKDKYFSVPNKCCFNFDESICLELSA